ncbi:MAG TPA: hypothetical protein VJT73_19845 [Polyangiaceae bacterium]|nr:hypothetical protein [Polyangiaceae bacterium]
MLHPEAHEGHVPDHGIDVLLEPLHVVVDAALHLHVVGPVAMELLVRPPLGEVLERHRRRAGLRRPTDGAKRFDGTEHAFELRRSRGDRRHLEEGRGIGDVASLPKTAREPGQELATLLRLGFLVDAKGKLEPHALAPLDRDTRFPPFG